jgi:hypothetical protein
VFDNALDIENGNRIYASEWIVQQNKQRVCGERASNLDAPAFPAGKADAQTGPNMSDMQFIE